MSSSGFFKSVGRKRRIIGWCGLIVCLAIISLILITGIRFFRVPSRSMEPTLYPGDFIIAQHADTYQRGDIVVFRDPDFDYEFLVKRIIGMGGDTISVQGGAVFLNDRYVSEPYRHSPIDYFMDTYQVPDGELFLLGDHSNASIDSHNWGAAASQRNSLNLPEDAPKGSPRAIPQELLIGRVIRIYLPWSRRGSVKSYPLRGIPSSALGN
jgi:signal peptidase I